MATVAEKIDRFGPRIADCCLLLVGLVATVLFSGRFCLTVSQQLTARYDIMYESPQAASIDLARAGTNLYSPAVYNGPPFILTMYTPGYPLVAGLLPAEVENPFLAGRLVSLAAALAVAAAIALVACTAGDRPAAVVLPALFFALPVVTTHAVMVRQDLLAVACAAVAIAVLTGCGQARRDSAVTADGDDATATNTSGYQPHLAALTTGVLVVAAVLVKQSAVAAGLAGLWFLGRWHRRLLPTFLVGVSLPALAFLAWVVGVAGNGFWFSTVTAVRQEITVGWLAHILLAFCAEPVVSLGLLVVALSCGARTAIRRGWLPDDCSPALPPRPTTPGFAFLCTATAVLLLTAGKEGASINYAIEPWTAAMLWLAESRRYLLPTWWLKLAAATCLTAALFGQLAGAGWNRYSLGSTAEHQLKLNSYRTEILTRYARHGVRVDRVINLVMPQFATAVRIPQQLNDPFLYRFLWSGGRLSQQAIGRCLTEGYYDVVVMADSYGRGEPDSRTRLRQLVDARYQPFFQDSFGLVHLRPRPPAAPEQADRRE